MFSAGRPWRGCAFRNDRSGIDRHKTPRTICGSGKGTAHASITCHLACHNFIAGFCVEYGNSGAGMHRGAFSLRRKWTSPRSSPRASQCRAGLASDPGGVTWGKGCRQCVSGQQSDSLQSRPWQRGLALFRPWWSVPYHLRSHDFIRASCARPHHLALAIVLASLSLS